MDSEQKYRIKLDSHCPVDVYVSSGNSRFYWPNRLERYNESGPSGRKQCNQYILDSGPGSEDVTDTLIEKANRHDPHYIIPCDVYQDAPATTERIIDFLDAIEDEQLNAKVFIPLQPPHLQHYVQLEREHPELLSQCHFAIGGLKDASPDAQLAILQELRAYIGDGAHFHGLGMGGQPEFIFGLRKNPHLLDSLDTSSPVQMLLSGKIADMTWRRKQFYIPNSGTEISSLHAAYQTAIAMQLSYMLSELCDAEAIAEAETVYRDTLDDTDPHANRPIVKNPDQLQQTLAQARP